MQTQRLRRLALHVLLAWLLVLATGVVNACVVRAQLADANPAAAHGGHAIALDADHMAGHEASAVGQNEGISQPPCERCCDEPSVLPQQAAKQQSDSPNGFWLAALPAPSFASAAASSHDTRLDSSQIRWGPAIPIPIAFLRLAL